jgi:unsaturated rhamnogalacturonyl hydrolase
MKRTFLVLVALFALQFFSAYATKITVENPLNFNRNSEIVEVKTGALLLDLADKTYILRNEKGQETGYQILKNNGQPILIFQANVPAKSAVTYTLEEGTPTAVAVRSYARLVSERSDDFAFENDIAAYRMYGKELEKIENPSNGVDIWMKYISDPVMDKIYDGRLSKPALSYHEDNGLGGFDSYDVGHSLGAGGVAPYVGKELWIGHAFDRYEIVESGPLRNVFTLIYDTVKVENRYYKEIYTVTVDAGSILNKAVVRYEGLDKTMQLATGIYLHGDKVLTTYYPQYQVFTYIFNTVTNKKVAQGKTYLGVYAPSAVGEPFEKDNQYIITNNYKVGNDLTYYFGGGSSRWKFSTDEAWFTQLKQFSQAKKAPLKVKVITGNAVRMADSEMQRNPQAWMLDFSDAPKWNYCQGLVLLSIQQVYEKTGDRKYYDYVKSYPDTMLLENGKQIRTYSIKNQNLDHINPGRILFDLRKATGDVKYKNALDFLRSQIATQPRTAEGGFWHKEIYPYQMWLDGIYMAEPFLAQYAATFNEPKLFDEIAHQITLIAKRTYDPKTGLYYHGWDEKKQQIWANRETGLSPHFWSRSIGWYAMAIVDVLDYVPANHPQRPAIIKILQDLSASLEKYRDPKSGMWYQVTDKPTAEGNYVESTGSIMFIYAWVKGAQKGYLDSSYLEKSNKAYNQFVKKFIVNNPDGTISLTSGCSVAGLGGAGNRNGSYEYYISEPVRDNDPKGTGPFIMTSLLLGK